MLKETFERFREKFKSKTCDCDSICEIHKIEEYEQFIAEEIKLAQEEVISYISQQQGWEESEDIYRTRFGFLPKYKK